MVSARNYFKDKVDDDYLCDLLVVLESFGQGAVTLETILSCLTTISPDRHRGLADKRKSALEYIRRKMNGLDKMGLVSKDKEKANGNSGGRHNVYRLADNIREELEEFLSTKNRCRSYSMSGFIVKDGTTKQIGGNITKS
jgi:hypothetical protein